MTDLQISAVKSYLTIEQLLGSDLVLIAAVAGGQQVQ